MSISYRDESVLHLSKKQNIEKYNTNTLSYRLITSLRHLNMSQSELARRVGMKPQIIQYLCSKNVQNSKFTFELAEALGVDFTWLSTGCGTMFAAQESKKDIKIPLLTWTALPNLFNTAQIYTHAGDYIYFNAVADGDYFALKMDDSSMEPRFAKNTVLIFDRLEIPRHGDFVLAWIKQLNIWLFREYFEQSGSKELMPLNKTLYKEVLISNGDYINGVLVQTICNFNRNRI